MFIQDDSGGNWVAIDENGPRLRVGQLIELEGVTVQTDFAPDISHPHWRILGSAPMPVPVPAEFGTLASTNLDSRWVEIEGIVRSASRHGGDLQLDVAMNGGRVIAYVPDFKESVPAQLVDARVRIRGVCGALFNAKYQVRGVRLYIPTFEDVQVIKAGPADPFMIPVQSVASVLRFTLAGTAGHRVKIRGVVTLQRPGRYFFLKDGDANMRVESDQRVLLHAGDEVDAVGFPAIGERDSLLEEAIFRIVGRAAPPAPEAATGEQLRDGDRDGELVRVDAQLLDRTLTPEEQVLIVNSGGVVIEARLEDRQSLTEMMAIETGSRLRITGISSSANGSSEPGALRILLRSPADVVVVSRPPWWTFRHALWLFGTMAGLLVTIAAWLAMLRRKIREQTQTIARRLESEKQTVKTLQERTTYLDGLIVNNPLAIAVMDSERRVVICNPAFERLFLFDASELLGRRLEECIVPVHERSEVARDLEDLATGETVFRLTRRKRKDGTLIDVEVHVVPLIIDGQISGCYGIYQDVSDRVAAEAELRTAKDASEAANRAKTGFLANMSHEIRTPLNGVLLAAELAAEENPTARQNEYLDTIRSSGRSLLLLLNDLLDLSKIEAGKMEVHFVNFSIRNCLAECITLLGARAQQKHLSLTAQMDENVPDQVCGDSLRLRQIVLNLVGNAIKFTDQGSIALKAACLSQEDGELVCQFSVQDTGIGIPPEKHALVFREFEQADGTATRRFGGTGLGLAISGKLVHLLGGKIWLESEVGRGSTFYFTARFRSAVAQPSIVSYPNGTPAALVANGSLRILLAEDNPVNQRLAIRLLEKRAHSVTAVSNGKEAVRILSEQFFDVILMDVHMPEMDGVEATRQIRLLEANTGLHTPIIAMTASAMKEDRDTCLEAGMDDYISKPIHPEEVLAILARVMESSRERARNLVLAN